jgi:serine/alanine adding enzyme
MIEISNSPDKTQWSEFVYNHGHGNIFQMPEMAEIYKRTKNYEPISLVAVDDTTNEILVLLQALVIKEMGGIRGLFSSRSVIQGGPLLCSYDEKCIDAFKALMKYYDEIAYKNALYTEIRNLWGILEKSFFLNKMGYKYEDHLNILIDLRKTKDDLWSSLTKSRRRGVRYAKKRNLTIEVMEDKKKIPIFYDFLRETYRNIRIPLADITLFKAAYDILVPKNMAQFFLVKHDGEYIGGRIVLLYNKTAYTWYKGSKSEFMKYYPNDLMGWDIIERCHEEGYHLLDLGGAGKPGEKYGVRDFKMQFGGQLVNYGRFRKNYHPNKLKFSMKMFQIYKAIRGKYV